MRTRVALLGSTGSIGTNTLDVISRLPKGEFTVTALTADSNVHLLSEQTRIFKPKIISLGDGAYAKEIRRNIPHKTAVVSGVDGLREIAQRNDVDLVVFATSGSSCIMPLMDAIARKKKIALANKESLISAGEVIMRAAKAHGVTIVPIDSEHSAIFQCLEGRRQSLHKVYLTGSGGPLLNVPKSRFDRLSRAFILKHPRWRMGKKISVDSATMMNKGLEIIEAKWLFDMDEKLIEIVIHPEAIIHSMVELTDGAVFAEMGPPDMRLPIQYALTYPARERCAARLLEFSKIGKFSFLKPDFGKFPCLTLARTALIKGGTYPAVLNASDQEAVKSYLEGRIQFSDIPRVIRKVLMRHREGFRVPSINDILNVESWAREEAKSLCCR